MGIKKPLLISLASAACLIIVSFGITKSGGLPWRLPEHSQDLLAKLEAQQTSHWSVNHLSEDGLPALGAKKHPDKHFDFIVWGDSHAEGSGRAL